MTPERWQAIKKLLDDCADIDPRKRSVWLDEACRGETTLRQEVESYLAYEEQLTAFDTSPQAELLLKALKGTDTETDTRVDTETDTETDKGEGGRLVGPYRIDRLLSQGGMGAVYQAHREAEFEQRVALKLVRSGFETPMTLQRFHTERQILARLEHPNIARLLDGGTTEEGRPYFVMELIEGVPIDQYCNEHRLSVHRRLELIIQVCDALRFAHRNLVLHLDLKPGNILVTQSGVPKLLDFGISKLLSQNMRPSQGAEQGHKGKEDSAMITEGPRPFTLSYASPEQLLDEPITTASDLYSLGVVLYELLTSRLPCSAQTNSPAKTMWAICHDTPSAPSTVVRSKTTVSQNGNRDEQAPEVVAQTRERSLTALSSRLRGDIDAIVLKTLRKDPTERYASVEQLVSDLRHHLKGLPVEARQGNLTYRVSKYIHRHRIGLLVATTVVTTVLAIILSFTATLQKQLKSTERQRERSERLSEFMVDLFRAAEPDRGDGEPSVRELVDIGRRRLETELHEEPEVRAQLLLTLGQVYFHLGHFNEAKESQNAAIDVLRQEFGSDHPSIAEVLNDLSVVAFTQGKYQEAEAYCRESIEVRQRLGTEADLNKPRNNLAAILMHRGKLDEAETLYRQSLARRRAALGPRHQNVAVSLRNVALVLYLRGDFDAAEPLLQESLEIRLEFHPRDTTSVATTLASSGRLAHARGQLSTAEDLYMEALNTRRQRLGHDHLSVALLEVDLARLFLELDELDTAGVLLGNAFGPIYRQKPEGDSARAKLESVYGTYLAARGDRTEAKTCLIEGYRTLVRARGPHVLPSRDALNRLQRLSDSHPGI
jgi:serine/threonine-protein kinase